MMPLGTTVGGSFVLPATSPSVVSLGPNGSAVSNFEFGSLKFVWDLAFGAWNFQDFHKADYFCKTIYYQF